MDFSFGFLFGTKTTIRLSQFCVGLLTEVILKGKKVIVHYERYQKNMTLFSTGSAMINNGNRVLGLTAIDHGQSSVLFRSPLKTCLPVRKSSNSFFLRHKQSNGQRRRHQVHEAYSIVLYLISIANIIKKASVVVKCFDTTSRGVRHEELVMVTNSLP